MRNDKAQVENDKPNVIIIFLDDSGFSDFDHQGEDGKLTPNVTQLAEEGTVFRNFRVPQAICSASRSALMSACYPGRTKVFGAHGPNQKGLDPKYAILSEQLKKNGYATGFFGKWHLGDLPETRPDRRGFDESAGLMYSNDMWKYHPTNPEYWGRFPISYWENGVIKINEIDSSHQKQLTKWSTDYSMDFIEKHKDEPFFLYLAYSMPHVPIFCSDEFEGKSGRGLYGDVIMELDYSIGCVMDKLEELDLDEETLLVFSSDNGPWSVYGNHAGKTPFREAKATSFDGGLKSRLIVKYPGVVPEGKISDAFLYSIDLMPTICKLTGSPYPENEIDGEDVFPVLSGDTTFRYKRAYHAFSTEKNFEGVFSADGRWKLHLPHAYRIVEEYGQDGKSGTYSREEIDYSLFDMQNDLYENVDVKADHPELFEQLLAYANKHKEVFYKED